MYTNVVTYGGLSIISATTPLWLGCRIHRKYSNWGSKQASDCMDFTSCQEYYRKWGKSIKSVQYKRGGEGLPGNTYKISMPFPTAIASAIGTSLHCSVQRLHSTIMSPLACTINSWSPTMSHNGKDSQLNASHRATPAALWLYLYRD